MICKYNQSDNIRLFDLFSDTIFFLLIVVPSGSKEWPFKIEYGPETVVSATLFSCVQILLLFLLSKEKKESADTPDNLPGFVKHMEEVTKAKQRGNNVEKLKFEG